MNHSTRKVGPGHGKGTRRSRIQPQTATLKLKVLKKDVPAAPGGPKDEDQTITITINRLRRDHPASSVARGEVGKKDVPSEKVTCRAECRFNPDNYVEFIVPAEMFEAPTQAEANELARQFGEDMAASMLDCSVTVTLKLNTNNTSITAYVYITDADGNETGPYTIKDNQDASVTLEDHAPCTYRANFYNPSSPRPPQTGSFTAVDGHEVSITPQ